MADALTTALESLMGIAWAALKFVAEALLGMEWWHAAIIVLAALFVGFLLYQQGEHTFTSLVTRWLVWGIIGTVVIVAIVLYMNSSGGFPGL